MSNIFTSSIGKKFWMALIGLFLCVFLVLHMSVNLLLLLSDRSYFDMGVHIMSSPPVKVMEVVLFGSFALHICLGLLLQIKNWLARGPERYAKKYSSENSFFSKYMIWTGGVIFIFLCLHFMHFYFIKLNLVSPPGSVEAEIFIADSETKIHNFYEIAHQLYKGSTAICLIYIGFMALLSFHLFHAFQSAFQSIGWNHPTYTPIIKWVGNIYAVLIPLGFAIIPLYFLFGGQ